MRKINLNQREHFNSGQYTMGVYPSSCGGDKPEMRAWYVNWLDVRSSADGGGDVDDDSGRLVE